MDFYRAKLVKVLDMGISSATTVDEAKYIKRTNFITLTIQFLIIPYSILFYVLGAPLQAKLLWAAWLLFLGVYFFNKKQWHIKARLWLLKTVLVCLVYFGGVFGQAASVHYLFFVFITIPFLLFPLSQYPWLIVSIVVFVLAFFSMEFQWFSFQPVLLPQAQRIMHIAILVLVILWLLVNYLYYEITNKQAEAKLRASNAKLLTKNKELEQFAYIASHDLQEPLLTINNFSTLFADEYGNRVDDEGKMYLKYITGSATRMSQLVKGLMEYSRVGREPELTDVNCKELVNNVVQDLTVTIGKTQASIQYNGLPTLKGYETELRLLFQNLLSNAIKFSKKEESPVVKINSIRQNGHWLFTIEDNGIGVEEKYKEKIFNIFQRVHRREVYEGTGIGLAHCRKIVDLHGGKIWVESEINKGSIFYFTIPV
jgi:signal transduction histidine kinase